MFFRSVPVHFLVAWHSSLPVSVPKRQALWPSWCPDKNFQDDPPFEMRVKVQWTQLFLVATSEILEFIGVEQGLKASNT